MTPREERPVSLKLHKASALSTRLRLWSLSNERVVRMSCANQSAWQRKLHSTIDIQDWTTILILA